MQAAPGSGEVAFVTTTNPPEPASSAEQTGPVLVGSLTSPLPDPDLVEEPGMLLTTGPGVSGHWLESMRREGLLVPLGASHYLAADAAQWPVLRRIALRSVVPPGHTVQAITAAWAHGAPVVEQELCRIHLRPAPVQTRSSPAVGLVFTRGRLPHDAITVLDGLELTTPSWTAADLAIHGGAHVQPALEWLMGPGQAQLPEVLGLIRRRARGAILRRATRIIEHHRAVGDLG